MKRVTIHATPLVVELKRHPADEFGANEDRLLVQVWRGDGLVYSESIPRGEAADRRDLQESVTADEFMHVNSLIAIEWLDWTDTTSVDLPPSKSALELYEELGTKLAKAKGGEAA